MTAPKVLKSPSFAAASSTLRIGLLIDLLVQPAWICKIIQDIQSSTIARIEILIYDETGVIPKNISGGEYALYRFYRKLDDSKNKSKRDAFEMKSISDLLPACPSLTKMDIKKAEEYQLDVVLFFGNWQLNTKEAAAARYGVWTYSLLGDEQLSGFWEVMNGDAVTSSALRVLSGMTQKIIYHSDSSTDLFSVRKSRNDLCWKSADFVLRKLKDLYEEGPGVLENLREEPISNGAGQPPKNGEMASLLFNLGKRYLAYHLKEFFFREQWCLAYQIKKEPFIWDKNISEFKWLSPPSDRFWADPFPVSEQDRYYVFYEEYFYQKGKGHISCMELDKDGVCLRSAKVLERDYHLAYPFIFKWQGSYYMIPETSKNKSIELFRAVSFPFHWEFCKTLFAGVNAVDTTLAEIDGLWWMFVNMTAEGNRKNWDELYLFYADNPLGPWTAHKRNPVKSDIRSSRPAGRLLQWEGKWYRPAQDCSQRYGYALSFNQIARINPEEYIEKEVSKILPDWKENLIATHTFNRADELTVIDGMFTKRKYF